jgi:hypothetical protein
MKKVDYEKVVNEVLAYDPELTGFHFTPGPDATVDSVVDVVKKVDAQMKYYQSFSEVDRLTVSLKMARQHISEMCSLAHVGIGGADEHESCMNIFLACDMYPDLDLDIETKMLEELVAERMKNHGV